MDGPQGYYVKLKVRPRKTYTVRAHLYVESKNKFIYMDQWNRRLNLYAEYIMQNAGLDEAQAGINIAGRNSNNLRYADNTNLTAESKVAELHDNY